MGRTPQTTEEKKNGFEQRVDKFYQKTVELFSRESDAENVQEEENAPDLDQIGYEEERIGQETDEPEENLHLDDEMESDLDELDSLLKSDKEPSKMPEAEENKEEEENHVTFTLFFSADKMNAYIRAQDYKRGRDADNSVPTDVIYQLLKGENVTYGIDEAGIVEYCKGKAFYKDFQVATGLRPVKGEDGRVEYFFSMNVKNAPVEKDDGTVDYKELGLIQNVNAGDVLCRITPPTDGVDGVDVLGRPVKATPGKPAVVNSGKGVNVSEDGLEYAAACNGLVEMSRGTIEVKELYTIAGDVGPATGNIRFNGSVKVMGSVLSDYAIFANGDIIVNGYVEASILTATGSIMINNGINGMKKGFLKADGNVTVKFAEMARIVAGENFYCDYCINCDVRAVDAIIAKGKRGSLLGGNYMAGKTIEASVIGSDLNIPMDLQLIPDWQNIRNLKIRPEERIKENNQMMSQYEAKISKLKSAYDALDSEITRASRKNRLDTEEEIEAKKKKVLLLMQQKSDLRHEISELGEKREKLNRMNQCEGCMVIVKKIIHTSVRVTIGSATYRINGHMDQQTFVENSGIIEWHNVIPSSG